MDKSVVLWSGGFDSTGLVLWALNQNYEVFPLFLNRHQSNYKWEKKAIDSLYVNIKANYPDLRLNPVREFEIITPPKELKSEFSKSNFKFVYFLRNSDLLINAIRLALCLKSKNIFMGSVMEDIQESQNFPDNHPEYLKFKNLEINKALDIMKIDKLHIKTPFTENNWGKEEILNFLKDQFNKVDLKLTRSCYTDTEAPCEQCKACNNRQKLNL
ncbi:hypothetical protein LCGC14_0847380 [marine sediment metagenome]|uniref:7-cyano-7-deazaguanine synthase n=1 Tax=marine sediment metagenome TaxID=412755 RepID=A0A0F9PG26_9ZZZZ